MDILDYLLLTWNWKRRRLQRDYMVRCFSKNVNLLLLFLRVNFYRNLRLVTGQWGMPKKFDSHSTTPPTYTSKVSFRLKFIYRVEDDSAVVVPSFFEIFRRPIY